MKKCAAESQNKHINSKHTANTETMQSQKYKPQKQMQQRNAAYSVNTTEVLQPLGGKLGEQRDSWPERERETSRAPFWSLIQDQLTTTLLCCCDYF